MSSSLAVQVVSGMTILGMLLGFVSVFTVLVIPIHTQLEYWYSDFIDWLGCSEYCYYPTHYDDIHSPFCVIHFMVNTAIAVSVTEFCIRRVRKKKVNATQGARSDSRTKNREAIFRDKARPFSSTKPLKKRDFRSYSSRNNDQKQKELDDSRAGETGMQCDAMLFPIDDAQRKSLFLTRNSPDGLAERDNTNIYVARDIRLRGGDTIVLSDGQCRNKRKEKNNDYGVAVSSNGSDGRNSDEDEEGLASDSTLAPTEDDLALPDTDTKKPDLAIESVGNLQIIARSESTLLQQLLDHPVDWDTKNRGATVYSNMNRHAFLFFTSTNNRERNRWAAIFSEQRRFPQYNNCQKQQQKTTASPPPS